MSGIILEHQSILYNRTISKQWANFKTPELSNRNITMDIFDTKVKRSLKPKHGTHDELAEKVAEIRTLFKEEYEKNKDIYDKRDYDRFMDSNGDEWHARRWLMDDEVDVPRSFEMLKETMKWRKDIGLNDLSYEDFPREFYELCFQFEYGHDMKGRNVVYIICRRHKPNNDIFDLLEKFSAFLMDQCDKRSGSHGTSVMLDVAGSGLSNVDWNYSKFLIRLKDRLPYAHRQILVVGLPWILNPAAKLIMAMVPESFVQIVKFVDAAEVNQYIDDSQIPFTLGGTSKIKFQSVPVKAKSITDFKDIDKSAVKKFKSLTDSYVDPNGFETIDSFSVIR